MFWFSSITFLIYGKSQEDNLQHLQSVLTLLQANKFYTNKKKCTFGKVVADYLGHTMHLQVYGNSEGAVMKSRKIQVVWAGQLHEMLKVCEDCWA